MVDPTRPDDADAAERAAHFRTLPEHVRLEDTIATQEADGPPDPTTWQDPERDLLRSAAWLALG